jgi:glycosyltransferase involved in cell wall biosynthesis
MYKKKISLILGTKGRTQELERFMEFLNDQTYRNFELIIVDQNNDHRLDGIINRYKDEFDLRHIKTTPGLSKARNEGLKYATGDIIAFPDDDCWYKCDLLECVANFFEIYPEWDGLTGRAANEFGGNVAGRWDNKSGAISKLNVWKRGVSISVFIRSKVVGEVGLFDEKLGVGANTPWGSGEETDYLIRAIQKGFHILYNDQFIIMHPEPTQDYNYEIIKRGYLYGAGMGYVLKKHNYELNYVIGKFFRPLVGAIIYSCIGKINKAKYHWNVFKGRVYGWKTN